MHEKAAPCCPGFDSGCATSDDAWLDEVLRESFPASDPAPWRHKESVCTTPASPESEPHVTLD